MPTHFEEYALLEAKIKDLTNQKDSLKVKILEDMALSGAEKIETSVGKFTISKLKTWTYPEKVVALGEKFKAEKAKAESTGEATYVESPSLRFTAVKL